MPQLARALSLTLVCLAAQVAHAAPPVIRWDFGSEESSKLTSHGDLHRDAPGPRPPEFPEFEPGNTAVKLAGNGAHFSFPDSGPKSPFDFTNGDAITIEAWVHCEDLRAGENRYVIGKGRTRAANFPPDNQNWALRIREGKGKACVSFLFATPIVAGAKKTDAHWHRWTTREGFAPGSGWHHIAAAYRFGEPASVRGWIDGKPLAGDWDMGGQTQDAPVVDDDEIWIGSSNGGQAANSFRGSLDAIALHREVLTDDILKTRYVRTGDVVQAKPALETMPALGKVPAGKVLLTFTEGLPAHDRWLNASEAMPAETARWEAETLLMTRLPQRYDAWGIRDDWKAPVLARLAAEVHLPPGKQKFLLRARGLSRLWVNDQIIARTKPLGASPSGEEPITPVAKPPFPGARIAEHRQQEVIAEATIAGDGPTRIVLETMIGGKKLRADPGEICVAVQLSDGQAFVLLPGLGSQPTDVRLTDADVTQALARQEAALAAADDEVRRRAAASQDDFWNKRHAVAQAWVKQHPVPAPPSGKHPIDAFLAAKIERAKAEASQTTPAEAKQFHTTVLSVLRDECFRCHGDKEQGGLRLNSRAAALKAGDSEQAAVVPGDLAKSELIRRIKADADERMPPGGAGLKPEQIAALETWIKQGANWPAPPLEPAEITPAPMVGDTAFLRRVYLDVVGVPPTEDEIRAFLADPSPAKRTRVIDQLLADERQADHWMGYWQDVLAENPTLLNPSLNTTGPFRWFLYDALRDGKAFDRLVTELVLLRGSIHDGGSAGFGIASDNDAPLAAKGQIVASAFLGIELQCARCHDSPYHSTKQRDLYSLAAMFERKPVTTPKTSRVPDAFFEKQARESLIKVTLKATEAVTPTWPFAEATGAAEDAALESLMQKKDDSRERLATLITAPQNTRFAQVLVNRIWRRYLGAGLVEPVSDWEGRTASHPELLDWLAREFVAHDYSLDHITRLILTSEVYQREAVGRNLAASHERRFFAAPERRRLSAEQVVDTLYAAAGQPPEVEELTFDPDGRRAASNRLSLGVPRRAWMFASLANERDRPSLSLPKAQAVSDVLEAFGWSGSRQNPRTDRETAPNVLQPGVLANGTAAGWLTRASVGGWLAQTAAAAPSPEALVDSVFLRYLGRKPTAAERAPYVAALSAGFSERLLPPGEIAVVASLEPLPRVTWSNHLRPESTTIAMELEKRARTGPAADPRLRPEWREALEDLVWSVVNSREFVWIP